MRVHRRREGAAALVLSGLLGVAACGAWDGSSSGGLAGGAAGDPAGGTLVFGAASDPVTLDPAYASDGESLRVVRQVFEGLVTTEEGGTEVQPALASKWTTSDDGLEWTFTLREGVTFHDGTELDAEAVCVNFDRWSAFTGQQQSPSVSSSYQAVFGGYADNESEDLPDPLYESCTAEDPRTAVIALTSPSASFLPGLTLPAFSVASPQALEDGDADAVSGSDEDPRFEGAFGTETPIGTGPFQFDSWEVGNRLVLSRYDDYWGEAAELDRLIFRPIPDPRAREQALQEGEIQVFNGVDGAGAERLRGGGFQLLERPAFNVGYVGFNSSAPPLDDLRTRQAFAHAIDRDALIRDNYPEGSQVATQFMPPELLGYAEDVMTYEYDPEKARQLIAESGVVNPTVEFWYPTGVALPYLPDPVVDFRAMQADLEAAGFTVDPRPVPWGPQYSAAVRSGRAQVHLLGANGDFADADAFVGAFFGRKQAAWGELDPAIYSHLEAAQVEADVAARTELLEATSRKIMEFLPGVPYVHSTSFLVTSPDVAGLVPSPVSNEVFARVTVED
jgi:peptide/nickel transport system substrate-binding protein